MTKDQLRPIEYNTYDNPEMEQASTWNKAWFHLWYVMKLPNDQDTPVAVIELEDGSMHEVSGSHSIRFLDREPAADAGAQA